MFSPKRAFSTSLHLGVCESNSCSGVITNPSKNICRAKGAYLRRASKAKKHPLTKHALSGVAKLTWSSSKGVQNRALFACKNGLFASSFLLSGIALYRPQKRQICLSEVLSQTPFKPDRVSFGTPNSRVPLGGPPPPPPCALGPLPPTSLGRPLPEPCKKSQERWGEEGRRGREGRGLA